MRLPLALWRIADRVRPRPSVPLWYSAWYRLPISSLEGQHGLEPRRADYVLWFLGDAGVIDKADVLFPERATYDQMARVHEPEYLESLTQPAALARIFAADPTEIHADEIMLTMRLACGGTLAAARSALDARGPALNLLGGFHHAGPRSGGGLCAVNDIAIALSVLRGEGFGGRVAIIDLDAHPPDGTAQCLQDDPNAWIGSLSGCDWGALPRIVDETVLPRGCGDATYLEALGALLGRMPSPDLAFVIAGGDVLAGDHLGGLGLTLDGARRRDLAVKEALAGIPSVWLPGGGYHDNAWRVLAGTALALLRDSRRALPTAYDPLTSRFSVIARELHPKALRGDEGELTNEDLEEALGLRRGTPRLLGYYTAEGVEYALYQYGILDFLRRLGYEHFHVELDRAAAGGDVARLWARRPAGGDKGGDHDGEDERHLLVDLSLERVHLAGSEVLYVHWMSLRDPHARFSPERPKLPGQEVPGLGLAREFIELFGRIAKRLKLAGIAYRPAWFHTAWPARARFQFLDAARQGRFEALARDTAGTPLLDVSLALAEGRVRMNDAPYTWEADPMVFWIDRNHAADAASVEAVAAERGRVQFTLDPKH